MAGSSVGSDIFAVVSFLVISLLVLLLLRHYVPLRSTPAYLLVPVFLALALPCYIILMVPIDLASADGQPSRGIWLPERAVLVIWRITYWLTFLLTWFLLPFLGEYCDSGARDPRSRALYSLRSNAQYMLVYFGTAVAGLVYLIFQNGFHLASVKSLVVALAYAWGLLLAIGLMGHGLVALPRRIYKSASVRGRLHILYTQAPKTKEKLEEATEDLEQLEHTVLQLRSRKNGVSYDMQDWIDDLSDTTALPDQRPGVAAAIQSTDVAIPPVVTERYLADLTRKLQRARHKKVRFVAEWNGICDGAQSAEQIIAASSSKRLDKRLDIGSATPGMGGFLARLQLITPSMRYTLHATILPTIWIGLAGTLALASIMVVWSEVVRSFAPNISIMSVTVVHHPNSDTGKIGFAGQLIAAAWLLYMDACTLYAIADVKVWGNRALVKRQTYAESACWYSLQVAKLTVPLSYNFITMLPKDVFQETSFFKFLGELIILTPLGKGFSQFFPCLILIPVLATMFNLYGKTKKVIGFGVLEDDSEDNPSGFGTGGWREGKALVDRELHSRSEGGAQVNYATRGATLDLEHRAGGVATHDVGPAQPLDRRQTPAPTDVQRARRHYSAITNQPGDGEDDSPRHFYQDFTERVRNTFDTLDRPDFVKNFAFKAPKWMQNDQRDSSDGPASSISRWFGGRPEEGRLQLG